MFAYLLNFVISRLNPRGAAINKKDLQVDDNKATVVVKAKINEEMYVFSCYFCHNDNHLSSQVLKLVNKPTTIFCLWKASHH